MDEDGSHFVVEYDELDDGDRILTEIEGKEIAVFKSGDSVYAVANYCVHQGGPLCKGSLSGQITGVKNDDDWEVVYKDEGEILACPWHGWEFDIKSGDHLASDKFKVPTYDTHINNGKVYVSI